MCHIRGWDFKTVLQHQKIYNWITGQCLIELADSFAGSVFNRTTPILRIRHKTELTHFLVIFDFAADPRIPIENRASKKNQLIQSKTVACDPVTKFLILQNCLKIPPPFSYFGHNHLYLIISLVFKMFCPLFFFNLKRRRGRVH